MTVGLAIEIAVNLVQQFLFIGFLYLFFDKPESKIKRVLPLCLTTILLFVLSTVFTTFIDNQYSFIDPIIVVSIMLIYSLLFLKGKITLRIIIPIAIVALYAIVVYSIQFIISSLGQSDFEETLIQSTPFRYLYLFTGNFVFSLLLFIILRLGRGKLSITNISDILSFIVIPLISCIISITTLSVFESIAFSKEIQLRFAVIIFGIALMTAIFWFLFFRISKDSRVKSDLLLSRQREEMYRESVISSGEQIRQMSEIKHDMKNDLKSIYRLIENNQYDEAKRLCAECSEGIEKVYTPINTDNPTLNAILNVEIEKAQRNNISFSYTVTDSLRFVSSTDVVSIIGNLCDNAIEYLSTIDKSQRKMSLEITVRNDYRIIICRNTILSSVLSVNPDMKTTKGDETLHGKGLNILRSIADKYNGTIGYREENNNIEVTLIIRESK